MPNTPDDHTFNQLLGRCINDTMELAAVVDGFDEEVAIGTIGEALIGLAVPREILALAVASLAVRMHRTSALNSL